MLHKYFKQNAGFSRQESMDSSIVQLGMIAAIGLL